MRYYLEKLNKADQNAQFVDNTDIAANDAEKFIKVSGQRSNVSNEPA